MRILTLLAVLSFSFGGAAHVGAADKPNILLICVDDLKPLLGCYGNELVKSSNIDALAQRGLRFDRAYCNQAVCAPSRNALLTGRRPQTLGIYDLGTNFRHADPDIVTLPQHFKNNGYRTEAFGKIFHEGHGNYDDAASWSRPHWKSNVVRYYQPENQPSKTLTREEALFSNVPGPQANKLPKGAAFEAADVPDNAYPDGQVADKAIKRLEAAAKKPDEPFFLAVGFVKPHLPFCAPKKYWDLYDRADMPLAEFKTPPAGAPDFAPTTWGELRNYSSVPDSGPLDDDLQRELIHGYHAAISYMDAQLGRVITALDANGLAENTIIVFWGDHGYHLGDHGMWCKHTNYEQATRIPLIVIAPGFTKPATVTEQLVESVDLYPTLCRLAGLQPPTGLDGIDLSDVLAEPAANSDKVALHVFPRKELIGRGVRTARHRLVEWKQAGAPADSAIIELYDYDQDPLETKNVATEQPKTVAELRAILDAGLEAKPQIKIPPAKAGKYNARKTGARLGKKRQTVVPAQ